MGANSQITNLKVGRRADENENLPNNWESLDINNLKVGHNKVIFLFGGNTTTRPEAANGNAKIIKSLLNPEFLQDTAIYSISYSSEPISSSGLMSKEHELDTITLFEKTFKPMLFDSKGNIKQKKGIEQAFSKTIFASHCGGSNFVNIIIDELYNTLLQYYPQNTAEQLIDKIQYFSYAPHEAPKHNVNAFFIAPYNDSSYSWSKGLDLAEEYRVDTDYPKGITKSLIKARGRNVLRGDFEAVFKEKRAIMFKVGQITYFIPNRMNPRVGIGDHTIECIAKPQFLHSGMDFENNAQLANMASRVYLNEFLSSRAIDSKLAFNKVAGMIDESSSGEEKE